MLRIIINVQGSDEQSESELAAIIASGLVKRGYTNLVVMAFGEIGVDVAMKERMEQRLTPHGLLTALDSTHPIVTVTRTWH